MVVFKRFITLVIFLFLVAEVFAVPTRIMVRAKAKDAKFIGTSMGGAYVRITDFLSGRLLADGYTSGSTGNTDVIMRQPHARNGNLSNDETAGYLATLDIEKPVFVTIEVLAPVNDRQARALATTQIWVVPGKHVEGDGIILEIPGMVVNITTPQMHQSLATTNANTNVTVTAHVVMMCGCPISEGGMWDSNDIEVKAMIYQEDGLKKVVPLVLKSTNTFEGKIPISVDGLYEVIVYAYNAKTGNTGLDKVNVSVTKDASAP